MTGRTGIQKLDPRYGLQLLMQHYASVHSKSDKGYLDNGVKIVHEELLNVGTVIIGGLGFGIETCCLVVDWMYKAGKNCLGIAQYASNAEWLTRSKENLSHRPPTGDRLVNIASRILGVTGAFLGIFVVPWNRGDWVIKLHQDLNLYTPIVASTSAVGPAENAAPQPPQSTTAPSADASTSAASPELSAEKGEGASVAATSSPPFVSPTAPSPKMPSALKSAIADGPGERKKKPRVAFIKSTYNPNLQQTEVILEGKHEPVEKKEEDLPTQYKKIVPYRIQSTYIKSSDDDPTLNVFKVENMDVFKVNGQAKLSELVRDLELFFKVDDYELEDVTLDSFIHTINYEETPEKGRVFACRYPSETNTHFLIEILEVTNKSIRKVIIKKPKKVELVAK